MTFAIFLESTWDKIGKKYVQRNKKSHENMTHGYFVANMECLQSSRVCMQYLSTVANHPRIHVHTV
jgi:hypothetical protein